MAQGLRRWVRIVVLTLGVGSAAFAAVVSSAAAQTLNPIGVPVPADPTVGDVLSTSAMGGDGQGFLPGADTCRSAPETKIALPGDDAAHDHTYLEWWWWYGQVETRDGRSFGYLMLWESKPWARMQIVQYAVTDLSDGSFHSGAEHLVGTPPKRTNGFEVRGAQTSAVGGNGRDRLSIRVDGYDLSLSLRTVKPPVVMGRRLAFCNDAYLYSRVRMPTKGTLRHRGQASPVTGTSHFDHSWGFTPAYTIANTTGIGFELDDGRDIFVGDVRVRENGEEHSLHLGYISDARGRVTILHRGDFTLTPKRYWRRDATCSYPVEWDVELLGEHLTARAALESTEIRTTDPRTLALWPEWPTIWDGPTTVVGTTTGRGWLDLTHYCYA